MQLKTKDELEAASGGSGNFQSRDDLYDAAVDIVIRERRGSCSLLQRALGIGYGRAARLIDFMAEDGLVGQYNGSQARDVLISLEDWEARNAADGEPATQGAPASAVGKTMGSIGNGDTVKTRTVRTSTDALTAATAMPRRRNKIVPEPDEPSDLEDDSLIEDSELDEEETSAGKAATVAGNLISGDDTED